MEFGLYASAMTLTIVIVVHYALSKVYFFVTSVKERNKKAYTDHDFTDIGNVGLYLLSLSSSPLLFFTSVLRSILKPHSSSHGVPI